MIKYEIKYKYEDLLLYKNQGLFKKPVLQNAILHNLFNSERSEIRVERVFLLIRRYYAS
jgi:hypothetical protein